eukprot:TRINITY_DN4948_c0_g1_i2.p1 TRINITY_DN4948_c0_g1~~TRINITY_DN4948_c0_g1_i2.p1  ORF type:complete len:174 (+),score=21.71 TRINITY_DN4948_c0_g1_i2:41-523(+)
MDTGATCAVTGSNTAKRTKSANAIPQAPVKRIAKAVNKDMHMGQEVPLLLSRATVSLTLTPSPWLCKPQDSAAEKLSCISVAFYVLDRSYRSYLECFFEELLTKASTYSDQKLLQYDDIAEAVASDDRLNCLKDFIPERKKYGDVKDSLSRQRATMNKRL